MNAVILLASLAAAAFGFLLARFLARGRGDRAGTGWLCMLDVTPASEETVSEGKVADLLLAVEDVLSRSLPDGARLQGGAPGEFAVILTDPDGTRARAEADRLRETAEQVHVPRGDGAIVAQVSSRLVRLPGPDAPASATETTAWRTIAPETLTFHLQPIVDLGTGRTIGAETLMRVEQTDGTAISPIGIVGSFERFPNRFRPLLPDLLIRAAAPVLAAPEGFVTVNVTGALLDSDATLSGRWLDDLLTRLPADRLVVEIVETAVLARPGRARELIDRLHARGARIALDDFGTGLSSLDRLHRLPVDMVKLDRAFVASLGGDGRAETVLRHLVRMMEELGIEIVAEGIETAAQAEAARGLGLRMGQGFHLGRPAPSGSWPPPSGTT